jgi:hypothetical protein
LELSEVLAEQRDELRVLGKELLDDRPTFIGHLAAFVAALATGNPGLVALSPFAERAVAWAFANSANELLSRELAAMTAIEERRRLAHDLAEPIEALIGQALLQMVRVSHRNSDDVKDALGELREDLKDFREHFP